ncbi:MAG: DNA repair protein RadA [Bdellovibrionales bacterium]
MAKAKSVFVCQQCGTQRSRWEGRCTDCGSWNSFVEERQIPASSGRGARSWNVGVDATSSLVRLDEEIAITAVARQSTGLGELDRVLGGGLVNGSFVLVGGDPGIGKSTLLLQMSAGLAKNSAPVLYVSAEESVQQISLRARRLGVATAGVKITSESSLDRIMNLALGEKPSVLIVDSIQTVYMEDIASAPGSVGQVRECAAKLMSLAKAHGITVFIIGHVTKDGSLAGPRVLEHMVDTVLSFEGDGQHHYRLLRALKNRFGATNELGVFEMAGAGLQEVMNPSAIFLEERSEPRVGAAIFPALEGSRPMLVEVQALTNSSPMANPRRTALGLDLNRVHMLAAVLDKFVDLELAHEDIFVNVVGGLRLTEPSCDLAIAAAIWSTKQFRPLPQNSIFLGEIGLTGEVRAAVFVEDRLKEAVKLGFKSAFLPLSNQRNLKNSPLLKQLNCHWIRDIKGLSLKLATGTERHAPSATRRESPRSEEKLDL